jgi:alpha 1,2-mannosyltransferase
MPALLHLPQQRPEQQNITHSRGTEAAVAPFMAIHRAAQQDLTAAGAVWRSRGPAGKAQPINSTEFNSTMPQVVHVEAQLNITAILAAVGEYPPGSSSGKGIVLVGGGKKYTPPAYGCMYFIRRSGCQLPIELWTPPHEPIPPAVMADFAAFGNITVRSLGDGYPPAAFDDMQHLRYLGKQLAILASSFQEIMFLDADNLPLRDPSFLFEHPSYTETGLLVWPDFWDSQVSPGTWEALGVPPKDRPPGSFESGQMLLDKHRCWQPLLLAIYFNMQGKVFYPLFSTMGQGDKETIPLAWLALGRGKFGLIPHQVMAVGTVDPEFHGVAMLQHAPDGSALFLHAHLPKLDIPKEDPKLPPAVPRQWAALSHQVPLLPPGYNKTQGYNWHLLNAVAGFDVEVTALQLRRYLRCQPAWVACCMAD